MAISTFPSTAGGGAVSPTSENRNYAITAPGTYTVDIPTGLYYGIAENELIDIRFNGTAVALASTFPGTRFFVSSPITSIELPNDRFLTYSGALGSIMGKGGYSGGTGGTFILGADANGTLRYSTDGYTFTNVSTNVFTGQRWYDIKYANSVWVAAVAAGKIASSTDGITWTNRSDSGSNNLTSVAYGNSVWAVGGDGPVLRSSTDAITWTTRTSGFGANNISGIAFGNGIFVAVGTGGTITSSTDAITWTTRTSGVTDNLSDVMYGATFVAYRSNYILTSTNAVTWTSRTTGQTAINRIAYGDGIYVLAGGDSGGSTPLTSTDTITWTTQPTQKSGIGCLFGDGKFIIGTGAATTPGQFVTTNLTLWAQGSYTNLP